MIGLAVCTFATELLFCTTDVLAPDYRKDCASYDINFIYRISNAYLMIHGLYLQSFKENVIFFDVKYLKDLGDNRLTLLSFTASFSNLKQPSKLIF